jgi:hypothetical protein
VRSVALYTVAPFRHVTIFIDRSDSRWYLAVATQSGNLLRAAHIEMDLFSKGRRDSDRPSPCSVPTYSLTFPRGCQRASSCWSSDVVQATRITFPKRRFSLPGQLDSPDNSREIQLDDQSSISVSAKWP